MPEGERDMSLREAAQQALEALERGRPQIIGVLVKQDQDAAITALRTALAEPEQEPVAWGVFEDRNLHDPCFTRKDAEELARLKGTHAVVQPLYTHPPQRKPLTDEEILLDEVLRYHFGCNGGAGPVSQKGIKIIRAIERAHGIGGEA
jgi:hypothetical protein